MIVPIIIHFLNTFYTSYESQNYTPYTAFEKSIRIYILFNRLLRIIIVEAVTHNKTMYVQIHGCVQFSNYIYTTLIIDCARACLIDGQRGIVIAGPTFACNTKFVTYNTMKYKLSIERS